MPIIKCAKCGNQITVRLKPRSLQENSYYWGVVLQHIADTTGYTPEEVHDAMRWKFLRVSGWFERVRSTTSLTTTEFEEYLEKIRTFAVQELDCPIPLPKSNNL